MPYLCDGVETCMRNGICPFLFLIYKICLRFGLGLLGINAVWDMGLVRVKVFEGCKGYWDVVDGRFRRWKGFDGV